MLKLSVLVSSQNLNPSMAEGLMKSTANNQKQFQTNAVIQSIYQREVKSTYTRCQPSCLQKVCTML